jgi:osmoprotectant transport system permease protein
VDGLASFFEYIVDQWDDILALTIEHAIYIVTVVISATIVSVAIAVWTRNRPVAREIALAVASVFLTLPSLALFVLFIPVFGLGFWPPFVALFMYAILPILRNTVTGLSEVNPAVIESARGMGLSSRQVLVQVQLPLAWPVIITGIRVSVLLTAGIAAIATLVAGGGLGDFIKDGLSRLGLPNGIEAIWTGTVFIVALALAFDGLLVLVRRATTPAGIR